MKRAFAVGLLVAGAALTSAASTAGLYTFRHENVLGTSLELKIAAPSPAAASRAEKAALDEIDRLARILSAWDPASEFSHWNSTRGTAVGVSPALFEVLGLFDRWRVETGGALDASAETIGRAWKKAAGQGRVPTAVELAEAVRIARQPHWRLDAKARTATRLDDAPIALNSLAKSYIVGRAASAARASGATGVTANIGGDLAVRGQMTETVDIVNPRADAENGAPLERLRVRELAVATSGGYRRGYDIGGRHYSHIVDPRTGQTADDVAGVTVAAADAATAGALATAFSVMRSAQSLKLTAAHPGVEFMSIAANGQRTASPGWSRLVLPLTQAAIAQQGAAGFELALQFTLARISDARYRRPYVAVWIEDKDKFPIRTLALWLEKSRWLPDLKSWYRADRLRALAEGSEVTASVSSATRPPGKYSLKWDLKDAAAKAVKPGRYTVCIEAAREHGTYQIIRQDLDISGATQQMTLQGNLEIESASLDYRKATATN